LFQEVNKLAAWAGEDFLQANGDPQLSSLLHVDGSAISPYPEGSLEDQYHGFDDDIATYPELIGQYGFGKLGKIVSLTNPDLLSSWLRD